MTSEKLLMTKNHIYWIDGIKGLSCLFIFLHHYCLQVFPAAYYGSVKESKLFGIDTFLSQSPLGIFLNGNFFVFLYIFISGYVITYQIIRKSPADFGIFHLKRYFKLMLPLLVYCLVFIAIYCFSNDIVNELLQEKKYNLFTAFKNGIYRILFFGDTAYGGNFWMMNYIFLGGLFVSIVASTIYKFKTNIVLGISIFFSLILFINLSFYYCTVFIACSWCIYEKMKNEKSEVQESRFNKYFYIFMFIIAVILGAYPTELKANNFYRFLELPVKSDKSSQLYHLIAAVLLFVSISKLNILRKFFEANICLKLARISYAFYIFHGLVLIMFKPLFTKIYLMDDNYLLSAFSYLVISLLVTITFSSILTNLLFSKAGNLINEKIQKWSA